MWKSSLDYFSENGDAMLLATCGRLQPTKGKAVGIEIECKKTVRERAVQNEVPMERKPVEA